jgi:hypothetical protein
MSPPSKEKAEQPGEAAPLNNEKKLQLTTTEATYTASSSAVNFKEQEDATWAESLAINERVVRSWINFGVHLVAKPVIIARGESYGVLAKDEIRRIDKSLRKPRAKVNRPDSLDKAIKRITKPDRKARP